MAKPSGEIIETPITTNFREGLSVLQYFISTHGARKGLADTALKTANSGYLTRRLVDVAQDAHHHRVRLRHHRRHRAWAPWSRAARSSSRWATASSAASRSTTSSTRTPARCSSRPNEEIDRGQGQASSRTRASTSVKIRSVLTCETRRGICVACYGRDLARGHMVNIGEAVGVIAAQSIGEPGTQLTMRTFHIGGVGQVRTEQSQLEARYDGVVKLENVQRRQARRTHCGGHEPPRRDRHRRRDRPRARALRPDLRRAAAFGRRTASGQGGPAARRVGSVLDADPHRGRAAS